ncbi:MAG: phage baseplate assembly protein V [Desulfobacteraceae bacterium]|nr:phage baseplate assembly protein V [Desulfobacteraceae bacterium]
MFEKQINTLHRKIKLIAGRAVINLVNDSLKEQTVQLGILEGETRNSERYQHYGFTSHPLSGAESVFISAGGSRNHIIVVADGDRRYRPRNLAPGEVALYTHEGLMMLFKAGGDIEVTGCGTFSADGHIADSVSTLQAMRDIFNTHTHASGAVPDQEMD